jgi:hypothetical protein
MACMLPQVVLKVVDVRLLSCVTLSTTNVSSGCLLPSFNADFQECEYTGRRARRALEGIR